MSRRLTTEEFILRSREVHGGRYDYTKSVYKTTTKKLVVTCHVHGDFEQLAMHHMKGRGCPRCTKGTKATWSDFIKKATDVHGTRYTYDTSDAFPGYSHRIEIECESHGRFQQLSGAHLRGAGCLQCGRERRTKKVSYTLQDVIDKSESIFGKGVFSFLTEDNTEFSVSSSELKLFCNTHGREFNIGVSAHFNSAVGGCPDCNRDKRLESNKDKVERNFIEESCLVHNDKYDYSRVVYSGYDKKVDIICPHHGVFQQDVYAHRKGAGCPLCATDMRMWGKNSVFKTNQPCSVYIIRVVGGDESFLKVGISLRLEKRIDAYERESPDKTFEMVKLWSEIPAIVARRVEIRTMRKFKSFKYRPATKFNGWTECFLLCAEDELKNYIESEIEEELKSARDHTGGADQLSG